MLGLINKVWLKLNSLTFNMLRPCDYLRAAVWKGEETNLQARLHRFINHSATFELPNSKAVYMLTHIVFYLSEYCRSDTKISVDAVQSLIFCGILAHLD